MILYDYQERAVENVLFNLDSGINRVILTMPTGSGKTVTAAAMIRARAKQGKKSLFVVDRSELVNQAARHLRSIGLQTGILQADRTYMLPDDEVTVATVQTIRSREAPPADFILIDEVHILHETHLAMMDQWPDVHFVGLSATPLRKGLGKHFMHLIRGPSVRDLMEEGRLVRAKAFCPTGEAMQQVLAGLHTAVGDYKSGELSEVVNTKELVGDIVETWLQKAHDRKTLCFAVNIAHSKAIVEDFRAAGIHAEHLDAYSDTEARDDLIDAFRGGEVRLLSSVNVLGLGFDAPDASCAILARPTLSEAVHMQQIGRVLRPASGKQDALLLDHAGNTLRFGLPEDFVIPDLDDTGRPTTKQKRKQRLMVDCTACGFVMQPSSRTCPNCGVDRQLPKATVTYIDGELVEYSSEGEGKRRYSQDEKLSWYAALKWHAERQPRFKNPRGWVYYAYIAKFNEKPLWEWWSVVSSTIPAEEQRRWIKYHVIRQAKGYKKHSKPRKMPRTCIACQSSHVELAPGKGPHAAGLRCGDCGKHLGWVSKSEYSQITMSGKCISR